MPASDDSIYQTGEYARSNPTYHVEDSPWKAQQILRMITKNRLAPRTVCEIGCGAGEVLKQMQSVLPPDTEFAGYEISPQAFELCKQRENQRLRFFHLEFPDPNQPLFDLLLCIDVVEHVEDYRAFLRDLRGLATQKIFHIPLDLSVQSVLRAEPISRLHRQAGHLHYFTKETALATLQDTGYVVLDWFYTPGAIANPGSVKARLASWPRQFFSTINQDLCVRMLGGYSLLILAE